MRLDELEPCVVEFEGTVYLVFREDNCNGADYRFLETGKASEALVQAYFDELYRDSD